MNVQIHFMTLNDSDCSRKSFNRQGGKTIIVDFTGNIIKVFSKFAYLHFTAKLISLETIQFPSSLITNFGVDFLRWSWLERKISVSMCKLRLGNVNQCVIESVNVMRRKNASNLNI